MTKNAKGEEEVDGIIRDSRKAQVIGNNVFGSWVVANIFPEVCMFRLGRIDCIELTAIAVEKNLRPSASARPNFEHYGIGCYVWADTCRVNCIENTVVSVHSVCGRCHGIEW